MGLEIIASVVASFIALIATLYDFFKASVEKSKIQIKLNNINISKLDEAEKEKIVKDILKQFESIDSIEISIVDSNNNTIIEK